MTKNDLYRKIDDLESKLNNERGNFNFAKVRLAEVEEKYKIAAQVDAQQSNDYLKQAKEIKRLEMQNKKFMQAIDALKKAAANQEIMQDRYARETALKLAYAVATSDDHLIKHAKLNYEFITNTEPEEKIEALPFNPDDLKFTHIDEA